MARTSLDAVLKKGGQGVFQLLSDSYRTTDDEFAEAEMALVAEFAHTSRRPVSNTVHKDIETPDRGEI